MFLSTLAAYFLGQKELFKDLYLEQAEEEQAAQENRTPWQVYPVLYLDFNTGQYELTGVLDVPKLVVKTIHGRIVLTEGLIVS